VFAHLCLHVHHKKKVREFPVPSRDVTTKLSLGGNNDVITELFLPREGLVSDIPAGDGKLVNLFLRCRRQSLIPPVRLNWPLVVEIYVHVEIYTGLTLLTVRFGLPHVVKIHGQVKMYLKGKFSKTKREILVISLKKM
jgi:hypothetical protein